MAKFPCILDPRRIHPQIGSMFQNNSEISRVFSEIDLLLGPCIERYPDLMVKNVMLCFG